MLICIFIVYKVHKIIKLYFILDEENKRNGGSRREKSGEKPSEDQVEKMEERLEAAQADQKNLFLIIFQVKIRIGPL